MRFNSLKTNTTHRATQEVADAKLEQWTAAMRIAQPVFGESIPTYLDSPSGLPPRHVAHLTVTHKPISRVLIAAACLLGAVWLLEMGNPTIEKPVPIESDALLLSGYAAKARLSTVKTPADRLIIQQQNEEANRAFRKTNQRFNRL